MLALTVSDPDFIAILALIVATAASLPAWLNLHRSQRNRKTLGEANGGGSLVEMTEQTLTQLDLIAARVDRMDRRFDRLEVQGASLQTWTMTHEEMDQKRFDSAHQSLEDLTVEVRHMPCVGPHDHDTEEQH